MNIKIMPIPDLIRNIHNLLNNPDVSIVFATLSQNYYYFGSTPFLHLEIPDVTKQEDTNVGILNNQIQELDEFIMNVANLRCSDAKTIYICCDAGLSRSPAIALYVAQILGDVEQYQTIKEKYHFANLDLYNRLINTVKTLTYITDNAIIDFFNEPSDLKQISLNERFILIAKGKELLAEIYTDDMEVIEIDVFGYVRECQPEKKKNRVNPR